MRVKLMQKEDAIDAGDRRNEPKQIVHNGYNNKQIGNSIWNVWKH